MGSQHLVLQIVCVTYLVAGLQGFPKHKNYASNRQEITKLTRESNGEKRGMHQDILAPKNADQINGALTYGGGLGMPFGLNPQRIDNNPLIGATGLTKNSLADIMFGNLKGLVSGVQMGGSEGDNAAAYNNMQNEGERSNEGQNMMFGGTLGGEQNGNLVNTISNGLSNGADISRLAAMNGLIASSPGLNSFSVNPPRGGGLNSFGMNGVNPNFGNVPNMGNAPEPITNSFGGGGPVEEVSPAIGMKLLQQMQARATNGIRQQPQLEEQHHKRHHHHHHHHHHHSHHRKNHRPHGKSTTKVLLSLLVDKLKDIYEMDEMMANKDRKLDSTTAGKIGDALDELDLPKGLLNKKTEGSSFKNKTVSEFKTKLSFPVTIPDVKTSKIILKGNEKSKHDDEVDIQSILSNLVLNKASNKEAPNKDIHSEDIARKKSNDGASSANPSVTGKGKQQSDGATSVQLLKSALATFVPEIQGQVKGNTRNTVENTPEFKSHKPARLQTERARSKATVEGIPRSRLDDELKIEDTGSLSEFHKIKADFDLEDKAKEMFASPPSDITNLADISPVHDLDSTIGLSDEPKVSPLRTFSVSSLLNGEEQQTGQERPKIATLIESSETAGSDSALLGKTSPKPSSKELNPDVSSRSSSSSSTSKESTTKYLQAARVLGAVYEKVKDPVAKSSVETAIKAMLKVMKYEAKDSGSFAKKHDVPSNRTLNHELWVQLKNLSETATAMRKNVINKQATNWHH